MQQISRGESVITIILMYHVMRTSVLYFSTSVHLNSFLQEQTRLFRPSTLSEQKIINQTEE